MTAKILIVDDEPLYLKLLESNLSKDGYQVVSVNDGKKAVDLLLNESVDLVLMDVMMPDMDGFSALQRIRQFSSVPVIFLTAKSDETDRIKGLDHGADDYIVKPFSASEMLARVRANLRRMNTDSKTENERYFKHGDLKIDFAKAELWIKDEQVLLSANEYRLLLQFTQKVGQIISSELLLSTLWGDEYKTDKEILWVSITRLRQKIEQDPRNPIHILTKSGVGYYMPDLNL